MQVVQIWRKELSKINAKAAESLADPAQYANLFPDFDLALKAEQHQRQQRKQTVPASSFPDYEGSTFANLIEDVKGENTASPLLRRMIALQVYGACTITAIQTGLLAASQSSGHPCQAMFKLRVQRCPCHNARLYHKSDCTNSSPGQQIAG